MAKLTLHVAEDEQALARHAAERLATLTERAIAARGSALLSLTGGSTPRLLYALLADEREPWRRRIDWPRVRLFWGDERHVPPDHADSNFGMARDALVRHVPIPAGQVHRMRGELADAAAAAGDYERELRDAFAAAGRADRTFDVMLLGLGEDAHIASIFPGSELLQRRAAGDVAAVWAPQLHAWRITLTPTALLRAHDIVMVVAGASKADAVYAALREREDVDRWPAQLLRDAAAPVEWIVERAAAARVSGADAAGLG